MTRYIIIGAGAVGGTIGARLFEAGHDVVLVARGAHYQALRDHGLRFVTPDADRTLPIPTIDHPDALALNHDPHDVLILATKTQDSTAALDAWSAHATPAPPIILAQNGVENERLALRRFARAYGASVWLPATHLEPGVVESQGIPISGILHLGRYPSPASEDDFIRHVADDLEKSGFRAPVHADVMRWKYAKLLTNLGNAIEALTGPIKGKQAEALYERVRAEGATVLDAAAIPHASAAEQAPFHGLVRLGEIPGSTRGGGSSWQSLARDAGSVETDYLNGEITLLARTHAVPAPVNETLQRLTATHAREHRPPGGLTIADLTALINHATEAAPPR